MWRQHTSGSDDFPFAHFHARICVFWFAAVSLNTSVYTAIRRDAAERTAALIRTVGMDHLLFWLHVMLMERRLCRGPTYRNRRFIASSLLSFSHLRPPRRKAAVSSEWSTNLSLFAVITKRLSTVCATFALFLQTLDGTRRLRPACCISLTRSRCHGALRIWFGAPVPWIFTHRVAVGRAIRSVRATW